MVRRKTHLRISLSASILIHAFAWMLFGIAQQPFADTNWRIWRSEDGMYASYCSTLIHTQDGSFFMRHYPENYWTVFDGFSFEPILLPRSFRTSNFQRSEKSDLWIRDAAGFFNWRDNAPMPYWLDNDAPGIGEFCIVNEKIVLYEKPNELRFFTIGTHRSIIVPTPDYIQIGDFVSLSSINSHSVLLMGANGVASIVYDLNSDTFKWRSYPINNGRWTDFRLPTIQSSDQFYITAQDAQTNQLALLSIENDQVNIITQIDDPEEQLWIGAQGSYWKTQTHFQTRRIFHVNNNHEYPFTDSNGLFDELHGYIIESPNSSWISSSQGLVHIFKSVWSTPEEAPPLNSTAFLFHEDNQSRLWIGTDEGLLKYVNKKWTFFEFPTMQTFGTEKKGFINSLQDGRIFFKLLYPDVYVFFDPTTSQFSTLKSVSENLILIASDGKKGNWALSGDKSGATLSSFDGNEYRHRIDLPSVDNLGDVRQIYQAPNNDFWIAGLNNIARIHDGQYQEMKVEDSPIDFNALTIEAISDDEIWFGGLEHLIRYKDGEWSYVRKGLDRVRCILPDSQNRIWIASGTGVHCYKDGNWVTYTEADGLPSQVAYTIFEDSQGRIWAGTVKGFSIFDASFDKEAPETYLDSEKNPNQTSSGGMVRLVYSGIDRWNRTLPDRLYFSTQLNHGAWTPFTQKSADEFQALAPAHYLFRVRAMDNNWNIDPTPAEFHFTVQPPWYMMPPVIILAIMGVLMTVFYIAALIYHDRQLERLVYRRTAALVSANYQLEQDAEEIRKMTKELDQTEERERREIATDLHDRIGQSLAMCQLRSELLYSQVDQDPVKDSLRYICRQLEQANQDTRSLIFEISPPSLHAISLEAAIEELCIQYQTEHPEIQIRFQGDDGEDEIQNKKRYILFRCARELIINAIKHAEAKVIVVQAQHLNNWLTISVTDDGKGINKSSHKPGFGLLSIRERLKALQGRLDYSSDPADETRFIISVPLGEEHETDE